MITKEILDRVIAAHKGEWQGPLTLPQMEQAYRAYERLRRLQFSGPLARTKDHQNSFARRIAELETTFPAFRAVYDRWEEERRRA